MQRYKININYECLTTNYLGQIHFILLFANLAEKSTTATFPIQAI